ncbi:MAG: hypothetical protein AAFY81_08180 [Pseudomonadota bacterium]
MFEASLLETKSADAPIDAGLGGSAAHAQPISRPTRYRPRRTTSDRLRDALMTLAEGRADLQSHEETAWSSITFTGTRHEVVLDFQGHEAVEVGETFIAELPEHEFRIPGQLVADASVREVDHRFGIEERLTVTAVLLLLEES